MSYYEVLRWIYGCLPTNKTSTRWKIAYFYAKQFNPKDYEFILNVFNSYRYHNSEYVSFRKTFYYFAGLFKEKEAGQYVTLRYFRDKDLYPYMR